MGETKPIPDDYPRVTPYLCVDGAADAIRFYSDVLEAVERGRLTGPDGMVSHAEIMIGDSLIMLSDEFPEMGFVGPRAVGGTPVSIMVYVEDVDATYAKALENGASALRPVQDQFYGDRTGMFEDPWGHRWTVGTHIEDVSMEEMERRMAAGMAEMTET